MAEHGVVLAVIAVTAVVAFTALSGGISGSIDKVTALLKELVDRLSSRLGWGGWRPRSSPRLPLLGVDDVAFCRDNV